MSLDPSARRCRTASCVGQGDAHDARRHDARGRPRRHVLRSGRAGGHGGARGACARSRHANAHAPTRHRRRARRARRVALGRRRTPSGHVSATCLAEDFDAIFALVADVMQQPAFDERDRSMTRRADLLTAILQDEDDPAAVAVDVLDGAALSRVIPTAAARVARPRPCRALTRDDLVEFHRRWFTPEGAIRGRRRRRRRAGQWWPRSAREFESWHASDRASRLPPPVEPATVA